MFKKKVIVFIICISTFATLITSGFYYLLLPRIKDNQEKYIFKELKKVSGVSHKDLLVSIIAEDQSEIAFSHIKRIYQNKHSEDYVIVFKGKGLWGDIEGAIAVDKYMKVLGISFYQHQETPGLGGEISTENFQRNFIGKEFLCNSTFRKLKLIKPVGISSDTDTVDAISGATITSSYVEKIVNGAVYECFNFLNKRKINE